MSQTLVTEQLADLPTVLDESSGLVHHGDRTFWSNNDSGSNPELYRIDTLGQVVQVLPAQPDNVDWEELTKDAAGNLYIGDFGNNANTRTDLRVYRLSADLLDETAPVNVDTIFFSYGDQLAFPPDAPDRHFDMEAMVCWNDTLHLFSKDNSSPHAGITRHYRLPAAPGTYTIFPQATFATGQGSYIMAVTGAAISDDGQRLVLLNANSIWMFTDFIGSDFFSGSVQHLLLGSFTQKESICFVDDLLYLTDEKSPLSDGLLYRVNPSLFVGMDELDADLGLRAEYSSIGQLESVRWNCGNPHKWTLFDADGRLLAQGAVGMGNRLISVHQFPPVAKGTLVIQLADEAGRRAAMLLHIR